MYLIRETFRCKPGMAKELAKKFSQTIPYMKELNHKNAKILTDVASDYWTVVLESEVETLADFENQKGFTTRPEIKNIMKDYMTLVEGGKREIFYIEYREE